VLLCVADATVEARRARAARRLVAEGRVRYARLPYDDTWLRDSGPITLHEGERFRLLDFHFTAWGGKFEAGWTTSSCPA
jgi:agmatine/peptidylarginine deiminase